MGRPAGSKNKPKETLWQSQKENNPPTAPLAESQGVIEKRRRTRLTTTPPAKKDLTLSGTDSVETVSSPLVEEVAPKSLSRPDTKIIKGFVNIQQSKYGYYTGGDIHDTPEHAKGVASKATVATVYIAFEVKA